MRNFNAQLIKMFLFMRIRLRIREHIQNTFVSGMFYIINYMIPRDCLNWIVDVFYYSVVGDIMLRTEIAGDKPHGTHPNIAKKNRGV